MTVGNPIIRDDIIIRPKIGVSHLFAVNEDDYFPAETTATLEIYSRDWVDLLGFWPAASVTYEGAQVQIMPADLDPIPDGAGWRLYVQYPDFPFPLCWYEGRVWRQ